MKLTDRIESAWYDRCNNLVPSHNRDVILRISMQTFLEELLHTGVIEGWENAEVSYIPNVYWKFSAVVITVTADGTVPTHSAIELMYRVPGPPPDPNERWKFDE